VCALVLLSDIHNKAKQTFQQPTTKKNRQTLVKKGSQTHSQIIQFIFLFLLDFFFVVCCCADELKIIFRARKEGKKADKSRVSRFIYHEPAARGVYKMRSDEYARGESGELGESSVGGA
jgi:hypothetical protein